MLRSHLTDLCVVFVFQVFRMEVHPWRRETDSWFNLWRWWWILVHTTVCHSL